MEFSDGSHLKGISRRSFVALAAGSLIAAGLIPAFARGDESGKSDANEEAAGSSRKDASADSFEVDMSDPRVVTDDAGRELTIPGVASLERVFCCDTNAEAFIETLAPDLEAGRNEDYTEEQLRYLPEGLGDLPNLGTWSGDGTLNYEAIIAQGVQLLIYVTGEILSDADVEKAEDLQEQTGIPVFIIAGEAEDVPHTYRMMGNALGRWDRAEELAQSCEQTFDEITAVVATIPEDERIRVYYAEGTDGLQTEPENSEHFLTYKLAGAVDVADCDLTEGKGMTTVSLENVIAWNPQVIIAWDDELQGGCDDMIRTNPDWESIDAVINDRVYTIPALPYPWGDRPPSITRYIAMKWMCNKLYPDIYDVDMIEVAQDFYKQFYDYDLSEEEAKEILFIED
jgi:iron complex transport system substrate-binding protein